ncbi:uncharacterized protein si:ch211-136m16.8 isoform X2 [Erpetoichthys calabaricus]|uniref:uncharacterized protein si:ch211-136m16.8 isoform X2 n=1 Tax=Erpetoichthys calabaricus TaxID=27687 RepID=UPI002234679F|nr:uncharacterized protein si:ch211-136m16.8 isoform X2 [Erpetoichthys calabaricus]
MEGQPPATTFRSLSQSFWAAVSYFQGFFGNTLSTEAQPEETEQQAEDVSSTAGEEAVSTECCFIGEQEVTEVAETLGASCHGDAAACRVNAPMGQEASKSSVSPNTEEEEKEENDPSQLDTECLVTTKSSFNRRHRPATRRRHEDQTGNAKKVFAQEFGEWTNSKAEPLDQACAPQKKTAQGYVGWDTQQEFEVKEKTTVVTRARHPLDDLPKPSSITAWSSALENSKDEEADKAELRRTYATQGTTEVLQLTITQEYATPKEPQGSMCRSKVTTGSEQPTELRSSMEEDLLKDTLTNQTVEKLTNRVSSLGQSVQLCSTFHSAGEDELEMLTQEERLGQHVEPIESALEETQAVQGTLDLNSQSTNEVKPSFNVSPKMSPIQPSITRAGAFRDRPKSSNSPQVVTPSEEVINEMVLTKPEEQCKASNAFTQLSAPYPPHLELTAQAEHPQASEMKEESAQPINLEDPAGSSKLAVQSVTPEELKAGKLSETYKSDAGPEDDSTTFLMAAGLHSQSEDSSLNLHQEVPEKVKAPDKHEDIKSSYSDECPGASGPQVHLPGLEMHSLVKHREPDVPLDYLDPVGPFEAIKKPIHHSGLLESTIGTFSLGTLGKEASEEHPEDPSTDAALSLIVSSQECLEVQELATEMFSDERPKTSHEAEATTQHTELVEPPLGQDLEASQNEIPQLLKVSSLMCQDIREVATPQYPKNLTASTLPEAQTEISSNTVPETLLDTEKEEVEDSSSGQCPETSEAEIQQAKSQDSALKHLCGTSEREIALHEPFVKCLKEAGTEPNEPCPEKCSETSKLTSTEGQLEEPSLKWTVGQHVKPDETGPGAPPQGLSLTETVGQQLSESEEPSPGQCPEEPKTTEQNGLYSEMCPEDLELGGTAGQHAGEPSPEECIQDGDQGTRVDKFGISNLQQHPEAVTAGIVQSFQCAELNEPINKKHPTVLETSNQLKKLEELPKSTERRPPSSFTVIPEDDSDVRGKADQDGEVEKPPLGESPEASRTEAIYHFNPDLEIFPKVSQVEEFEEPKLEGQTKPSDRISQPLDGQISSQHSGLANTAAPVIETNGQCPEFSESWFSEPEKSLLEECFELSDKATSLLLNSVRHTEITETVVHKPEEFPGVSDVSEIVPQYGESEESPSVDGPMASKMENQPENLEESALQEGLDISDTNSAPSGVLDLSEYSEERKTTVQNAEKAKPSPEVCPQTSMKNTQLEDLEESVLHLHQDVSEMSTTATVPVIELCPEVRHIMAQHSQLDEPSPEECPELPKISDVGHIVSEELSSVEHPEAFQRETQIVKFEPPVLQEHNRASLPAVSSPQPFSVEYLGVQEKATQPLEAEKTNPTKTAKQSSEECHELLEMSQSAHAASGGSSSFECPSCSQKQNETEEFEQSVSQEHMEASPSAVSASSELSSVEDQLVPATPDQEGQHIKPEEPSADEHLQFSEESQLGPAEPEGLCLIECSEPEGLSSVKCPEASLREVQIVNIEHSVSHEHSKASPSVVSPPCEWPGVPGMVTQNVEADGTNTSDEQTKPEEPSSIKYLEGDTSVQSAGQEESSSEDNSAVASEISKTKDSESKEASRKEYPHYNQVTQHEESIVMNETAKSTTSKAETVQLNHTEARTKLTFEDHQLFGDVFDDHTEAPESLIQSDIPDFLAAECSSDLSRATAIWYNDYENPGNEAKMDTEEEENRDADICKCEDDQSLKGNVSTEKNLELEEKEVCEEESGFYKKKPKVLTARRCFSAGDELSAWDKEEMDAAFDDYSKDNVEWEIDKIWLSLHQKSDGSYCQLDSDDEQDDDDSDDDGDDDDDDDEMSEDNEESANDKIWLSLHQKNEGLRCQLDFGGGQEEESDDWNLQEEHFQQLNNYAMQKARNMLYSIEEEEETELDEEIPQPDKHLGAGTDVIMKDFTTPPQKENERVSTGAEMEEDERFSKAKEERDQVGLQIKSEDEWDMTQSGLLSLEESRPKGQELNTPTEDPESAILLSRIEEIQECPQEKIFPVSMSEDLKLKESVQILNFSCYKSDLLGGDQEEDGSTVPLIQVVETPSSWSGASHINHAVDGAQLQKYEEQAEGDCEKLLVERKQEAPYDYQEDTHHPLALDDKSKLTASEEVKVIDDSTQRPKEIPEIKVPIETLEETDGAQVKATNENTAFVLPEERDLVGLQIKNEDEWCMSTETASGHLHLEKSGPKGEEVNTVTEALDSAFLLSRTEEIQECPQEEIFSLSVSEDVTARLSPKKASEEVATVGLLSEQENESSPPYIKSADSAGSEGEEDVLKKGEGVLLLLVKNEDTTPDVPSHTASQSVSLHEDQNADKQEGENKDVDLQTNISEHLLLKETVEPGEGQDGPERLGDKDKGALVRNEETIIEDLRALETHEEENLSTSKINEDENQGVVEGNKEVDQDVPKGSRDETWNASEITSKVYPCMSLEREEIDEFVVERTDEIRVKDEDVLEINKEEGQGIVERIDNQNHDMLEVTTEGHQGTSLEREGHNELVFKRVDDTSVKDQGVLEINEEECEGVPQRWEDERDKASDVSDKGRPCVSLESEDQDEFVFKRIEEVNQGVLERNEKDYQDHPETHEMKACGISVDKEKGNQGLGERIGRDGESVVHEHTNDLEDVTSGITYGDNEGVLELSEDGWEASERKEKIEENVATVVSAADQSELGLSKVEDEKALERSVRESWETSEILQQEDTITLEGNLGQDQRVSEDILVENKALGHFEKEAWAESRGEELQSEERAEDEKQVYLEVMKGVCPLSNLEKSFSQGIMERTEERHEGDSEKSKEEEKHESDRNDKGDHLCVSVADEGVIEGRIEKNEEELEIEDKTTTADPGEVEDRIVSQINDSRHEGVMERNEEDDTRSSDIFKEEDEELSEKWEAEEAIVLGNSERGGKDARKSMEIEGADGENQVISDIVNERGQRAAGTIKECVLERDEGGDQVVVEINEEERQGMPRSKEEEGQDVPERKMEEYQAVEERKKEESQDEVKRNEEECQVMEERKEEECHDVVERKMEEYYGTSEGKQEEGQVKDMDIVENKEVGLWVSESFEEKKPQESFQRIQEDTNIDNKSQWAYQKMDLDGNFLSEKREKNEESSSKIIDAGDGSSTKTLQTDLEKEKFGSKAESTFISKRKETNEEETDGVSKISRAVSHDITLIALEDQKAAEVKEMKDEGASTGELNEGLMKRNEVRDQGASESMEDEVEGTSGNLAAERQDEPVVAGEETKSVKDHLKQWEFVTSRGVQSPGQGGGSPDTGVSHNTEASLGTADGTEKKMKSGKVQQLLLQLGGQPGFQPPMFSPKGGLAIGRHSAPVKEIMKERGLGNEEEAKPTRRKLVLPVRHLESQEQETTTKENIHGGPEAGGDLSLLGSEQLGPQLLDLSAQKSRIALRNKQCRPPQDPKEILKKPSLAPSPVKLPRPEGIGGVPLPFMLPGLGAGPPVLRKRETAPASIKQEPLVTMEVEQPKLGPQLLDLSVQKSRIALRNKQCRPPQDPKKILKKPSLDPSPVKLPRPGGIGGVPLPFMLPGLGAGPPVLRKREMAPACTKREPVATMEVEQPKVLPENQSDQGLETPPKKEVKPKRTPPGKVGFGMAHPQMMLELRGKLKKTTD